MQTFGLRAEPRQEQQQHQHQEHAPLAIYSCTVKVHSRSKGESATGGAAYRLGLDIEDERTGLTHRYGNRKDIAAAFTLLPENAPAEMQDPRVLWNAAEASEKRVNSCVSREVLVALPAEMTDEQREELARAISGDLVKRFGVGVSCGVHRPDKGEQNFHAHILMTTRRLTPDGFGEKTRELDDKKQGPQQVEQIRAMVAEISNEHLARHGYEARIDHRTLEAQRTEAMERGDALAVVELTREPTQHQGRNREVAARVGQENEKIREANQESQKKAAQEMGEMLERAQVEGRAMAPAADDPQAKKAMEQEQEQRAKAKEVMDRYERQGKEMGQVNGMVRTVVERMKPEREAVKEATRQDKQAGLVLDAAISKRLSLGYQRTAEQSSLHAHRSTRNQWEKEHPWRSKWLGVPKQMQQKVDQAKADLAKVEKRLAQQEKIKEKADADRLEKAKVLTEARAAVKEKEKLARLVLAKRQEVKQQHAYENRTPEQIERDDRRDRKKVLEMQMQAEASRAVEWSPKPTQSNQRPAIEPPQLKPKQRDRGRDYGGMSM